MSRPAALKGLVLFLIGSSFQITGAVFSVTLPVTNSCFYRLQLN